jgi:choline dehydrogenase-like flavoprotein
MLTDLEQAEPGFTAASDVCVVGAGIAGLLLAERLASRGLKICILEAGGLELEDRSQKLYDAEMAETKHLGTTEGRFRAVGGSSTRWGGQLLPYTDDVFHAPEDSPSRSWPIDDAELNPYYDELQRTLGVDLLPFDASLLNALGRPGVAFSSAVRLRFSKWIPFAKRNLAKTIGERVRSHVNITLVTHANVAELLGDGTRISAVRVLDYAGREFRFEAARYVVATGTIESSRLMLLSQAALQAVAPQLGIGFHDHLSFAAGVFEGQAREQVLERLGPFLIEGTLHTCKIEASAELRAEAHLLAAMAHVVIVEPEDGGVAAVRGMLRALQQGKLGEAIGKNLLPMLRGLGDIARLAWFARMKRRRAVSKRADVRLQVDLEQVAGSENRVRLSLTTDSLGLPKALVDWRVSEAERDSAARFAAHMREEFAALGAAPNMYARGTALLDTYHPMGGLLMGTDSNNSVVDTNLRVHGMENLFVASCAVFPAGGSSNPTFTLMALTLRLADALSQPR